MTATGFPLGSFGWSGSVHENPELTITNKPVRITHRAIQMDPSSCYLLEIKLIGNQRARKNVKCFSFKEIIDSELTNYKDLVESIVDKYPQRYLEVAHVQYYDANLQTYPEVR
ncbi:hypothetical protein C2845_PM01G41230 [Panicum miliaceum]|uniref:Uncharacterized protein n=1 Tax=Panicum miliaceum TaxID=4540 RepID=A0A3L6TKC6_PANMI|nr:hypothetical protein C2845_PM01G41230 [Panicum miliaceum]